MAGERPVKKLKLDTSSDENADKAKLKEEVKELEDLLASSKSKLGREKIKVRNERSKVKEERSKVEEERSKVEEERKNVERERSKVEEERSKVEEERNKVEEEKSKVEEEKSKVDGERISVEEERSRVEEERNKVQEEKRKVEGERDRVEEERCKVKGERNKIDGERSQLDKTWINEWHKIGRERYQLETEKDRVKENKTRVEKERAKLEMESNIVEGEKTVLAEEWRMFEEETRQFGIVEKLLKLVECPVCLTIPRKGPVPCCTQGHFVCSPCLKQLREKGRLGCPTCRELMREGKSLLALALLEQVQHECSHQGCTSKTSFDQIEQHEKECEWRPIVCPGSGKACTAVIPFCQVESHAQDCAYCKWPPISSPTIGITELKAIPRHTTQENGFCWSTSLVQADGMLFFLRVFKNTGGNFTVDVIMKGSQEECEGFLVEASVIDAKSENSKVAFKSTFTPRPLRKENKPSFCLSVPQESMSEVWKLNAEEDQYVVKYHIKVIKLNPGQGGLEA